MNSPISLLQDGITDQPYSIRHRLRLAQALHDNGYPDLAAGEAYIALLLVDECLGVTGEFEEEAFETTLEDFIAQGHDTDEEDHHEMVMNWVEGPLKDEV